MCKDKYTRYQELEQASQPQGIMEIFCAMFWKGSEKVKNKENSKLKWPNDHVFVDIHRKCPSYEQLDERVLGLLRQRHLESHPLVRGNMID